MRRIITIALIFFSFKGFSQYQYLGAPNITVKSRGAFMVDSIFYLPTSSPTQALIRSGALKYNTSTERVEVWNGAAWVELGSGGGGGSYSAGYGMLLTSSAFRVDSSLIQKKMTSGTGITIGGNRIYNTGTLSQILANGNTASTSIVLNSVQMYGDGGAMMFHGTGGPFKFINPASNEDAIELTIPSASTTLVGTADLALKADASHNHASSDITSGQLATARIAAGTATEGYIPKIVGGVATWSVDGGSGGGSGTVTSITQGYGIINSTNPITTTGTQRIDTSVIAYKSGGVISASQLPSNVLSTSHFYGQGTSGDPIKYKNAADSTLTKDTLVSHNTRILANTNSINTNTANIALKAPIANPTFTGIAKLDSDTLATKAYARSVGGGGGGSAGEDYLYNGTTRIFVPTGGAGNATQLGWAFQTAGSVTNDPVTPTSSLPWNQNSLYNSSSMSNGVMAYYHPYRVLWRGNAAGQGGFTVVIRGNGPFNTGSATQKRGFVGMTGTAALITAVEPTTYTNVIGIGMVTGDTNLSIIHNDGSGTATTVALGANFPPTDYWELKLEAAANASTVTYTVKNLTTGNTTTGTISTDLPSNTTFMTVSFNASTGATAGLAGFNILGVYSKTSY